jgi:hypothetical protein
MAQVVADPRLALTDVGQMRLMLSNTGAFGTSFLSRNTPSMEWPARSGIDHLARAALWVGAVSATGDTFVTIGARDAYYLDPSFQHTEFTPVEGPERFSRLPTSPFYRPGTVSDENFHAVFDDTVAVVNSGQPPHTPMGIRLVQETYGWGTEPVDDFVIAEFNVINVGTSTLQDIWIGMYAELVTNNRNHFANWPPGGAWFDFQDPQWSPGLRLLTNHNARGSDFGATHWAGIKLIGTGGAGPFGRGPDSLATKQITLTGWSWNPSRFGARGDGALYLDMSRGETSLPPEFDPFDPSVNPVVLLAVGPFTTLAPGDTMQAVFGFVGGEDIDDLSANASWAQRLYDALYDLTVTPVAVKDLTVVATNGTARLTWQVTEETDRWLEGIRIHRATTIDGPYDLRTRRPLEPQRHMWFEDVEVQNGRTYWYRLLLRSTHGHTTVVGPVRVTMGSVSPERLTLNAPLELADGSIQIRYSIPVSDSRVQIGVYDVRGRRIWSSDRGDLARGEHSVIWNRVSADGSRIPRGVHFVGLRACGQSVGRKLVVR